MDEKPRRVLLADDEVELVAHLEKRLTGRGLEVTGVTDGDEAVRAVSERTFDVALIDLKMPGKGGLEVLRELKAAQPTLEVIVLTGYGSIENAFESGRLAAFRFLTKPYDFDRLLGEIDEACAARRSALREAYRRELAALRAEGGPSEERAAAVAALRRKYEQPPKTSKGGVDPAMLDE